ncbi:MAG: methyltransferase [Terriglobia bacterium]
MAQDTAHAEQGMNLSTITQMNFSMAASRILMTAVQLGIFSHIAAGKTSVLEIAPEVESSERGTGMLLNALCAFQLLVKKDGRFGLHPVARQYLVRESPDYMGYMFESNDMWDAWGQLTEVVRAGRPVQQVQRGERAEEFFSVLVRSLHVMNREPARRLAQVMGAGANRKGMRVLDVACGSGVWGIALAEADPETRVTFQDFPGVLKVTADYLNRHRLTGKHDFLPGNLEHVDFGDSQFDLTVLGNICHSEGERASRDLFSRVHRALRRGGRIAIVETVPNDDRTGAIFPLIFALNMLLHTPDGGTYTLREYTGWLKEAGYGGIETAEIGLNSPLIIASKD